MRDRSFVEHLVEIQQLAGEHGEGGVFAAGERGVGLAFAVVQERRGILGVGAVVALEIVVSLARDQALVGGQSGRARTRAEM